MISFFNPSRPHIHFYVRFLGIETPYADTKIALSPFNIWWGAAMRKRMRSANVYRFTTAFTTSVLMVFTKSMRAIVFRVLATINK